MKDCVIGNHVAAGKTSASSGPNKYDALALKVNLAPSPDPTIKFIIVRYPFPVSFSRQFCTAGHYKIENDNNSIKTLT